MAFMFKGPAALTGASTIITANATITGGTVNGVVIGGTITAAGSFTTLTASGNITTSAGDLVVSGASNKLHLQGGAGLQFGGSAELDAVATGGANNNIVPTRGYVDDAVANAGGTVATSTIVTGDSSKTLVNGTTYLISSAGGVVSWCSCYREHNIRYDWSRIRIYFLWQQTTPTWRWFCNIFLNYLYQFDFQSV